jgi:hypothetical protein
MFDLKTMLEYFDSLFIDFEKERLSKKVYLEVTTDFQKKIDKTNKVIDFNGSEIQIVKYLSASDKYDLIMSTLQKSFAGNGMFDDFKAGVYFSLNVIYLYTNITFSAEDRADEFGLYDTLKNSGLMNAVMAEIDEEELDDLFDDMLAMQRRITTYNNTTAAVISEFIDSLPEKFAKVTEFVNNLNPEKLQAMKEMAEQFKISNN